MYTHVLPRRGRALIMASPIAFIALKTEPGTIRLIKKERIISIKAAGNYVEIYSCDMRVLHRSTLKAFMSKLTGEFVRVHRSYVINLHHLEQLRSELGRYSECVMSNQHVIPLSAFYRADVLAALGIKDD